MVKNTKRNNVSRKTRKTRSTRKKQNGDFLELVAHREESIDIDNALHRLMPLVRDNLNNANEEEVKQIHKHIGLVISNHNEIKKNKNRRENDYKQIITNIFKNLSKKDNNKETNIQNLLKNAKYINDDKENRYDILKNEFIQYIEHIHKNNVSDSYKFNVFYTILVINGQLKMIYANRMKIVKNNKIQDFGKDDDLNKIFSYPNIFNVDEDVVELYDYDIPDKDYVAEQIKIYFKKKVVRFSPDGDWDFNRGSPDLLKYLSHYDFLKFLNKNDFKFDNRVISTGKRDKNGRVKWELKPYPKPILKKKEIQVYSNVIKKHSKKKIDNKFWKHWE